MFSETTKRYQNAIDNLKQEASDINFIPTL